MAKNKKDNVNKKIPPHNIEAEQAVLASAIIDSNVIDELLGSLKAEDFYLPAHQKIFEAIQSLYKLGKPVDLVTLVARLQDENAMDAAGGYDYVTDLVQIIPNSANMSGYCNIIIEKALLRKMVTVGGKITELGFNSVDPVDELVNDAQALAYDLGADKMKSDAEHIGNVLKSSYDKLEKLYNTSDSNDVSGVPSCFPDLDKITNGFQPSDLIIVAGRPGMGKTSFGLNVLYNAAKKGNVCVFFSLEMSSEQLVNRIISAEKKISSDKLRTGRLINDDWRALSDFTAEIGKTEIYLDDTPQITVNQIRAKCRKLKSKTGRLDIVFVDYLQIMGFNKSITVREQQISEISRSLKSLAKELEVPVIAFAQVNRSVEVRADNRPIISDLRESGAIEQDADIIMFLYRDVVYNKETKYYNVAEVIIAKHRNGSTGTVYLDFDQNYTSFNIRPLDKTFLPKKEEQVNVRKRGKDNN